MRTRPGSTGCGGSGITKHLWCSRYRLLYTLERSDVASKPAAAQWAHEVLGERWFALIAATLPGQRMTGPIEPWEEEQTLDLFNYTVIRFHGALGLMH